MTQEQRDFYIKKYQHLGLYFGHGPGWDKLTLIAAIELDSMWPTWMPYWLKRLNNRLLYAYKGHSLVRTTKFYYSKLRKIVPFIKTYPRFQQIKEKFGGLRLYGAGSLEMELSGLSYNICENCGSTSYVSQTKGVWVKTLCKECMDKKK